MNVTVTRAYDEATPDDGIRVLVDRLWPRGVSKDVAKIGISHVAVLRELLT